MLCNSTGGVSSDVQDDPVNPSFLTASPVVIEVSSARVPGDVSENSTA